MSRRDLTEEELALWRFVTRRVTPHHGHGVTPAAPTPRHPQPDEPPAVPREQAPPPRRVAPAPLALGANAGIDRRTAQRFAKGQMAIEGRLDLHGRTLKEAQAAVSGFVRAAANDGQRFVIIITGKGGADREPGGRGRIRAEAIHWLDHPSLRPLILAVREAGPRHGGAGALYVLLRRHRST